MPDLRFALDGLYACGWWPSDGDRCLQHADTRWYPDESMILEYFAESIIHPQIRQSLSSSAVEVFWDSPTRGRCSVHGRTREEAMILAFITLYQETHAQPMTYEF